MKGTAAACAGSCITKVSPGILRGRVKPGRRMDIFGEKGGCRWYEPTVTRGLLCRFIEKTIGEVEACCSLMPTTTEFCRYERAVNCPAVDAVSPFFTIELKYAIYRVLSEVFSKNLAGYFSVYCQTGIIGQTGFECPFVSIHQIVTVKIGQDSFSLKFEICQVIIFC